MGTITAAPINPSAMQPAEFIRTHWVVNAEPNTTKEDILKNEYWTHVALKLKPFDLIEVRAKDGSFFGEYLVLACDKNWAKVFERGFYDLTQVARVTKAQAEKVKEEYVIKHKGPKLWSVIRVVDNAVLAENLQLEEDAQAWLKKFLHSRNVA